MTKGKLTPLALAIGFALSGPILGAEVTGPYIHSSQTFDEDTVYTVTNTVAVIGSDYTNPVEITIGAGKTLTLQNSYVNTQTKILDGTYRGGLTFYRRQFGLTDGRHQHIDHHVGRWHRSSLYRAMVFPGYQL